MGYCKAFITLSFPDVFSFCLIFLLGFVLGIGLATVAPPSYSFFLQGLPCLDLLSYYQCSHHACLLVTFKMLPSSRSKKPQDARSKYWRLIIIIRLLVFFPVGYPSVSPHQPQNVTWIIINTSTGRVVNATSSMTPPNTWWPNIVFDLCSLAIGTWDVDDWSPDF